MQCGDAQTSAGHDGDGSGKGRVGNGGSPVGTLLAPCFPEVWRYGVVKEMVANQPGLRTDLPCTQCGDLGTWTRPRMPRQDPGSVKIPTGEFLGLSRLKAGGDANARRGWLPKKENEPEPGSSRHLERAEEAAPGS